MQGHTGQYYLLFLQAKDKYIKEGMGSEFELDPSGYRKTYEKIKNTLENKDGMGIDSLNTRLQLTIEEKLSPNSSCEIRRSLSVFCVVRDAVAKNVLDFSNKKEWVEAIICAMQYQESKHSVARPYVPEEYSCVSESIFELNKLGFKIESIDGLINVRDPEFLRLTCAIDYKVSKLGGVGFDVFNELIVNMFSVRDMRFFFFRRRKVLSSSQKPNLPYGYLFNLFCKNIGNKTKVKKHKVGKKFKEVEKLSMHLSTILEIDKMTPYSNIYVTHENILEKLQEWILYPEVFYIPQMSTNHGKIIFPRLFELIDGFPEDCLKEIKLVTAILQRIEDALIHSKCISGIFSKDELWGLCKDIANRDELSRILNMVSVSSSSINQDYKTPFDSYRANIKEVPLVRRHPDYVVVNIATYNIGVYRTLLKVSLAVYPGTERKLGFALEKFIKERLDKSNIENHHSFKYFVPDPLKISLGTNRHEGECDFIVESKEYIFLVEVKKKGLTKKSWSGDIASILTDTTLSFVKSINQLSIAELILLSEKKIVSKSGTEIQLKQRDIFKLVISFDDMASLQTDSIKNGLLSGLYNSVISAQGANFDNIEDINKILSEFTAAHIELARWGEKYKKNPFHDISYLSTPQLLTILENANNNEEFELNICRTNSVNYSLMDWYASYTQAKGNKSFAEYKSVFKKSTMIN